MGYGNCKIAKTWQEGKGKISENHSSLVSINREQKAMAADFKGSLKKKRGKAKSKQPLCTQHKRCEGEWEMKRGIERENGEWEQGVAWRVLPHQEEVWVVGQHGNILLTHTHTYSHSHSHTHHQKNKQFHKICTTTTKAVGKYLNIYK